ncbi:hypothetical protein DYBT9275_00881 [Dyadobacter sp. CECT 9275]|uniref:Uncharacterized protein n=1 Tax=Dyadobacter helix TaxID=2822344 RepID=A0A916J8T0_9BACT|nr:hypothetical protein [Dyadobacter sp. CECT 9275]CAG4992041.1 hypothetical protein DYBT9275_00881 [Dyadobacter sp. CECT 9275]
MSKRIIRVSGKKIIPAVSKIKGSMLTAVLSNGQTFYGKLDSWSENSLVLSDQRQHRHSFSINELYEVVFDQISQA